MLGFMARARATPTAMASNLTRGVECMRSNLVKYGLGKLSLTKFSILINRSDISSLLKEV